MLSLWTLDNGLCMSEGCPSDAELSVTLMFALWFCPFLQNMLKQDFIAQEFVQGGVSFTDDITLEENRRKAHI